MAKTDINVLFVIPTGYENEEETSETMQQAFELCKQNLMELRWTPEAECHHLPLNKTDIIVFEKFEGEFFDIAKKSSCVVVGPWCILTCLTQGNSIPNLPWPVFNTAMDKCIVACSHLPKARKALMQQKIEFMAGRYSDSLTANCTHLVTDSVKSEKYIKAAEVGVEIMLSSWVEAVWEASIDSNVNSNDVQFRTHKCPPLYKLIICCTGFTDPAERLFIQKTVNEHGGTFTGKLTLSKTDVLICKEGASSEKFKAAKKLNTIRCVSLPWLTDSISKGYALAEDEYQVNVGTSTPTKEGQNVHPDFSTISSIGCASIIVNQDNMADVQETVNFSRFTPGRENMTLKRKLRSSEHNDLVDMIDMKRVKSAGAFLDGCSIYISGFGVEQREKLCKILNFSGATRYDELTDRVTHAIVGDLSSINKNLRIDGLSFVNVNWLIESIEREHAAVEDNFIVSFNDYRTEPSSPLSKKGLHLLRSQTTVTRLNLPPQEPIAEQEEDILHHYLTTDKTDDDTLVKLLKEAENPQLKDSEQTVRPGHSKSDCTEDETNESSNLVFAGLRFLIVGFEGQLHEEIKGLIETSGGHVLAKNFKGIPDYAVLPAFDDVQGLHHTAQEIVNDLWITECYQEKQLREVDYYHRPMSVNNNMEPLKGSVVTISSYVNYERNYLKCLITFLGGLCQEQLARVSAVEKGVVTSTHLVIPDANGKKYEAAIKWGLPVITKDWLLECAQTGELVHEQPFLVGDARAPPRKAIADTPLRKCSISLRTKSADRLKSNVSIGTPIAARNLNEWENTTPKQGIPEVNSQVTPVNKIMEEVRKRYLLSTPTSPVNKSFDHVDTPETPLGAFIRDNPSPRLRKEMAKYLNGFPEWKAPPARRQSTPLSELKRRYWDKVCPPREIEGVALFNKSEDQENPNVSQSARANESQEKFDTQLNQMQEILTSTSGNRQSVNHRQSIVPLAAAGDAIDTQPNTVGWEDALVECNVNKPKEIVSKPPIFMFSGLESEQRGAFAEELEALGAHVSNLSNYDPFSTHLISSKATRNEKILSFMAAGKWILHPSYVRACVNAKRLLDEECFEYGNPKSRDNLNMQADKENEARMESMHYWRKEVNRRGYGAFHDMRAIIVADKRQPLVRIIEAGGGMVIDESPPFNANVHATHCLMDPKAIPNFADYVPLAQEGIFCVSTLYISSFLQRNASDINDFLLPYFARYYTRT